ncbi:MAG: LON peptidase substrate-binding domain-containing protein [Vicinamibacterales bacterium]
MKLLPLFPLPNVVLFPGVILPLHIFEPRYRAMVADALDDDRRIGMVLLRPGWEGAYEERPPVYPVGCSGVIAHSMPLEDGRYYIVLQGLERIRILEEDHARAYRRAIVEPVPDPAVTGVDRQALGGLRDRLEAILRESGSTLSTASDARHTLPPSMPDEELVHTLSFGLDLEPLEKQALLERESLCRRAASLVELLEMKRLGASMPFGSGRLH